MKKNKDYILNDDGSVRNCPSNVSKMSVIEYIRVIDRFNPFVEWFSGIGESLNHFFSGLLFTFLHIVVMLLLPLVYWRRAHLSIKRNKIYVNDHS